MQVGTAVGPEGTGQRRILLLDGDKRFQTLASEVLAPYGFRIHSAELSSDCQQLLEELEPEVVIIAVESATPLGFVRCREIKRDLGMSVPVILVTSTLSKASFLRHQQLRLGADAYLDKRKLTEAGLVDTIVRVLERAGDGDQARSSTQDEEADNGATTVAERTVPRRRSPTPPPAHYGDGDGDGDGDGNGDGDGDGHGGQDTSIRLKTGRWSRHNAAPVSRSRPAASSRLYRPGSGRGAAPKKPADSPTKEPNSGVLARRIAELEAKAHQLAQQNAALRKENLQLGRDSKAMAADKAAVAEQSARLGREVERLTGESAQLAEALADERNRAAQLEQSLVEARGTRELLAHDLSKAHDDRDQLAEQIAATSQERDQLRQEVDLLASIRDRLQAAAQQHAQQREELTAERRQLAERYKKVQRSFKELRAAHDLLQHDRAELLAEHEELDREHLALSEAYSEAAADAETMRFQLAEARKAVTVHQHAEDELRGALAAQTETIAVAQHRAASLEAELQQREADLAQARAERDDLAERLDEQQRAGQESARRIEQLGDQRRALVRELKEARRKADLAIHEASAIDEAADERMELQRAEHAQELDAVHRHTEQRVKDMLQQHEGQLAAVEQRAVASMAALYLLFSRLH
jgi:CheY-like chemotaxis protein